jgi:soluble lytic murein transglycosylase
MDDPDYNVVLGARHLQDLLEEWNGSYILVIASYNAGSGRGRQWIQELGDPRAVAVDPIDWVESIPFSETRNYVQRVMENLQVYRHRLSGAPAPLRLQQDLQRGG